MRKHLLHTGTVPLPPGVHRQDRSRMSCFRCWQRKRIGQISDTADGRSSDCTLTDGGIRAGDDLVQEARAEHACAFAMSRSIVCGCDGSLPGCGCGCESTWRQVGCHSQVSGCTSSCGMSRREPTMLMYPNRRRQSLSPHPENLWAGTPTVRTADRSLIVGTTARADSWRTPWPG